MDSNYCKLSLTIPVEVRAEAERVALSENNHPTRILTRWLVAGMPPIPGPGKKPAKVAKSKKSTRKAVRK